MRTRVLSGLVGLLVVAVVGCGRAEDPSGPTLDPFTQAPTDAQWALGDLDVEGLQARWWEWAASEPEETNPVADPTGEDCARGQRADVWLVAGSFGGSVERRCAIPTGVPIAGPAVNFVTPATSDCDAYMSGAEGNVSLDGEPVPLWRVDLAQFSFDATEGNPVYTTGGTITTYGCGLWFAVPPLNTGDHTLTIDGGSLDFAVSVTYDLTVTASP